MDLTITEGNQQPSLFLFRILILSFSIWTLIFNRFWRSLLRSYSENTSVESYITRKVLFWFSIIALMVGLTPLSCGDSGGGSSMLDSTFGDGGKVTTTIGGVADVATALAIQSDGKLVAAGYAWISTRYEFALVRYNSDGSLDTTFNTTGAVTTPIGTIDDFASALAIQPDGKLVAGGNSDNGTQYVFALVRYNPDGSLDTTFNATGIVTTAIGVNIDQLNAIAIQTDGKLVAAGFASIGAQSEFALVRYNNDGSLDTTFNSTGIVTTAIGGAAFNLAYALAIQPDGKLVAAGTSLNNAQTAFALVRYNTDGSVDAGFGTGGSVTTSIRNFDDRALALVIQSDDKLVAAGHSWTSSTATQSTFAVVRYNPDGSLDTTFNTTGIVTTAISTGYDEAYAIAIQPSGKLVAAGTSNSGPIGEFALVRYKTNGRLDPTFDNTGIVTTAIGTSFDWAYALAIQADGKLVAAGTAQTSGGIEFALVRYRP
jgi:uncharacterized delta-60 repeat protein